MQPRQRLAIVGGGIAGLSLAAAVDPRQFEVVLYEAQPQRSTGAALGLWPASRRALERLGVHPQAEPDRRVHIHRLDGRRLFTVPTPAVAQVMRPQLMNELRAAVPASVVLRTEEVTDPMELDADLVVGADGVRSRVRAMVSGCASQRRETPWVALRGTRRLGVGPEEPASGVHPGTAREFWGPGRIFGDAPVAGGRYWFSAHRSTLVSEPLNETQALAEAKDAFTEATPEVRRVVEEATEHTLVTRLWTTSPLFRYRRGRYLVIGDAAHAALPNLGRGASDAILDAMALARVLNAGSSLVRWEARRVPVTQGARCGAELVMGAATSSWTTSHRVPPRFARNP